MRMEYYFDTIKPKYYHSIGTYRYECLEYDRRLDGCSNLEDYDDIEAWDFNAKLFELESTLPPGYSISYQYLYIEDKEVVGMLSFRPNAMSHPYLKEYGGHIGYSVRPSKRNMGIGKRMLKDFLPKCKEYGLDKILITCLEDNEHSRKIILANNGIYEKSVYYAPENKQIERYFINL